MWGKGWKGGGISPKSRHLGPGDIWRTWASKATFGTLGPKGRNADSGRGGSVGVDTIYSHSCMVHSAQCRVHVAAR